MIYFNEPPYIGTELTYMQEAIESKKICGDGQFTKKCNTWIEGKFNAHKALLTTSGTSALEMAAILCDIRQGDEVIMPSYTFVSTALAFVMRGAYVKFVDIRPDTMNLDENLIESAITDKTKAIVPVHYAGVSCEMDKINEVAKAHNLLVVEDAAQGVMSTYKGKFLGTLSDFGCYSFHETKNYSMGEGGALIVNRPGFPERAEIIREKGTNRSKFFRGQVDKYTWVDCGSSYLPSDMNAAYLWAQLEQADNINNFRMAIWNRYFEAFKKYADSEKIELPFVPAHCTHNAHMFYIKLPNLEIRTNFINYMKENDILTCFHYIPLHSSPAGKKYGEFCGADKYTTNESERLVRLPIYYNMRPEDQMRVIESASRFLNSI